MGGIVEQMLRIRAKRCQNWGYILILEVKKHITITRVVYINTVQKGKNEKWYFARTYTLQTRANEIFVNKRRNGTDIAVYKFNDVEKMNRNNGICGILYFTVFYFK